MAATDYDSGAYCAMDSAASSVEAVGGAEILTCIFDDTGTNLLAIQGEQESTLSIEAESSSVSTKDSRTGWTINRPSSKSWSIELDAVRVKDAASDKLIRQALENNDPLCVKQCYDDEDYTPICGGMAYVTAYESAAPSDDNATASITLTGTGKLTWFDIDTSAAALAVAKPSNRGDA